MFRLLIWVCGIIIIIFIYKHIINYLMRKRLNKLIQKELFKQKWSRELFPLKKKG